MQTLFTTARTQDTHESYFGTLRRNAGTSQILENNEGSFTFFPVYGARAVGNQTTMTLAPMGLYCMSKQLPPLFQQCCPRRTGLVVRALTLCGTVSGSLRVLTFKLLVLFQIPPLTIAGCLNPLSSAVLIYPLIIPWTHITTMRPPLPTPPALSSYEVLGQSFLSS